MHSVPVALRTQTSPRYTAGPSAMGWAPRPGCRLEFRSYCNRNPLASHACSLQDRDCGSGQTVQTLQAT
ncbi:hypothetical protein CGCS363_v008229 [Colletotrichum siamense]|uniref:uncharacterized protein n=1 Tax=Colletotrichum siamense TaxID=690259 RepID=UPI001873247B|nr:uncharacterized protein CGCS363_v008229 [Colletotrichum siamense]KAF5497773.1 hypothetical protein CGCS363_v008229 [Colletotrichum siamense]